VKMASSPNFVNLKRTPLAVEAGGKEMVGGAVAIGGRSLLDVGAGSEGVGPTVRKWPLLDVGAGSEGIEGGTVAIGV